MLPLLADDLPASSSLHDLLLWASFLVNLGLAWKLFISKSEDRNVGPQPFVVEGHDPCVPESKFKDHQISSSREMQQVRSQMQTILEKMENIPVKLAELPGAVSERFEEKLDARDKAIDDRFERVNRRVNDAMENVSELRGQLGTPRSRARQADD